MEAPQQGKAASGQEANPVSPPLSLAPQVLLLNERWNPTKEQLAVLEGLFENGVCMPNAKQIQHITARLREHGPVEAKNVIYWFQNNKVCDCNSHNQEGFACYTSLLRRPPPLPAIARPTGPLLYPLARMPPSPPFVLTMAPPSTAAAHNNGGAGGHVMYNRAPYYYMPAPATNAGYYNLQQAHHRAVVYPRMDITQDEQMNPAGMYQLAAAPYYGNPHHVVHPANGGGEASADHHVDRRNREILELFPLRPTFALPDNKACSAASPPPSAASASFSGGESESLAASSNSNAEVLPFYDFLGLQSKGR